jgi:hypothetical protein
MTGINNSEETSGYIYVCTESGIMCMFMSSYFGGEMDGGNSV